MNKVDIVKLKTKFSQLNKREQWLVFLIVIMVTYGVVDLLIIQFIDSGIKGIRTEIDAINNERTTLSRSINQKSMMNETEKEQILLLNTQKEKLMTSLNAAEREIDQLSQGFIVREESKELLDSLTRETTKRVHLVSLENFAAEATQGSDKVNTSQDSTTLYKHGFRLVTTGKYWNNADLVHSIENLPWRLQVNKVELESLEYPNTKMTLELYVLGRSSVWMNGQATSDR